VVVHLEKGQEISKEFIKAKLIHLGYKEDKKIDAGNFQVNERNICFMIG
jgi:excinuclease UvrABC helicase subunit UvrB